ncbi:hypothetical protein KUK83_003328 [Vibrio parahaemolyticus]|nr:hypothetical protein [Vibrio parahaemolyticus]EHR6925492.1 hypothetical protein [Vibrio parahaemolyticus]
MNTRNLATLLERLNIKNAELVVLKFEQSLSMKVMGEYQNSANNKGVEFAFFEFLVSVAQMDELGDRVFTLNLVLGEFSESVETLLPTIQSKVGNSRKISLSTLLEQLGVTG